MKDIRLAVLIAVLITTGVPARILAQEKPRPSSESLLAAQREAMIPLAYLDGVWRGTASTVLPNGEKHVITQTERIGPFLQNSVKIIEGRGYGATGEVSFNALGIVSFNPSTGKYTMRSYAMGYAGDYALSPNAEGFVWEIPAGPATMRYTAVVKDGTWHEVGDRIVPGKEPVRFFEMRLKRLGATEWPAGNAVKAN